MLRLIFVLALALSPFRAATDDGIGIDPNGGGPVRKTLDHRCTIDPNGSGCTARSFGGDRGAGLDPDGSQ